LNTLQRAKYRAKTIFRGEWVYGSVLSMNDRCYIYSSDFGDLDELDFGYGFTEVDKDALGQFTGLTDSKGVDIYEGSVCEFPNGDKFFIDCEEYLQFFVSWIGSVECEDQARDLYRISGSKVIGNIFDNPDLIGGEL